MRHLVLLNELSRPRVLSTIQGWGMAFYRGVAPGRPRNPFINAGTLVVCDINQLRFAAPVLSMRDFVRRLAGNPEVAVDRDVVESEYQHRARNAAAGLSPWCRGASACACGRQS